MIEAADAMREARRSGDGPLRPQILSRFGLTESEWTRIHAVYQHVLAGDQYAAELVDQVDAGTITIATAYRLVKTRQSDEVARGRAPRSLKLVDIRNGAGASDAFLREIESALRLGVPLNLAGTDDDALRDCARLFSAISVNARKIAARLHKEAGAGQDASP